MLLWSGRMLHNPWIVKYSSFPRHTFASSCALEASLHCLWTMSLQLQCQLFSMNLANQMFLPLTIIVIGLHYYLWKDYHPFYGTAPSHFALYSAFSSRSFAIVCQCVESIARLTVKMILYAWSLAASFEFAMFYRDAYLGGFDHFTSTIYNPILYLLYWFLGVERLSPVHWLSFQYIHQSNWLKNTATSHSFFTVWFWCWLLPCIMQSTGEPCKRSLSRLFIKCVSLLTISLGLQFLYLVSLGLQERRAS